MARPDDITIARLDGTARRLLELKADRATAITELQAVSTRPDLLARAGGAALGSWRISRIPGQTGAHVAELLLAAGADPATLEDTAAATEKRLRRISRTVN